MTAPNRPASSGTLVWADASKVSVADFLPIGAALFGFRLRTPAEKARDGELAQASIDHRSAMAKAPMGRAAYWERRAYDDECNAAYAARCREIEARYAEQMVEVERLGPGRIAA